MTKLRYYWKVFILAVAFYEISKQERAGWSLRECWVSAKVWIDSKTPTDWIESHARGKHL